MLNRRLHGFVGISLAATLTGCHMPANSPFTGLAQIRPVATPHTNVLPPAAMLHHPGPGVEGPGPGIIAPASYEAALEAAGVAGGGGSGGSGAMAMAPTSQIGFIGPDGMQIRWDASMPGGFDSSPLVAPGRYDFPQGAIYRLKLTDIAGREGIELYPSLEVAPVTPRTAAYLAHNAVPFQITEEDLDQVTTGNFVTKVVYLPDPDYQELAVAGVETLVSTRLDPGCDPVVEADRRGSILAIIRIGNKDLESTGAGAAGTPLASGGGPGGAGGGPGGAGGGPGGAGGGGACGVAGPLGMPCGGDPAQLPPAFVAGMTAPEYGMPRVGTPIGLPGPAHIPLGVPAGLQRHSITNHTKMHIPPPSRELRLHVQQHPGLSYPKPARHAYIAERHDVPNVRLRQPWEDRTRFVENGGADPDALGPGRIIPGGGDCPPEPME
ncbi:MAG: hypothetical protein LW698_00315 [Planctomycetaceae bacterium]|nr:hypothetical protein [Planctomycetaceae bacterium]